MAFIFCYHIWASHGYAAGASSRRVGFADRRKNSFSGCGSLRETPAKRAPLPLGPRSPAGAVGSAPGIAIPQPRDVAGLFWTMLCSLVALVCFGIGLRSTSAPGGSGEQF